LNSTKNVAFWVILFLLMIALFQIFSTGQGTSSARDLSFSEFLNQVENGNVASVRLDGEKVFIKGTDNLDYVTVRPSGSDILPDLRAANVEIIASPQETSGFMATLGLWLPFLLLIGVWIYFMNRMQGGGRGGAMGFGKSRAKLLTEKAGRVTFDDVAGIDEAKEELEEIVEFLRDPQKFSRLGGKIPKGALLVGPPGTGKTLLARAIAGEAGVPFFTISGSDFVEMFVGVGASRVRDMFEQAKKNAPCIVFVDEIDAVGRHRGAGYGGGNDEREQTLNQLLVEMDGFEANEGVILIAATNRVDVLAKDKVMMGAERRSMVLTAEQKEKTAYHEAGHAIVGISLPECDPVYKATIIPRGGALGMVVSLPEMDRLNWHKDQCEQNIAMTMAGKAAEIIKYGEEKVSNGPSGDIQQASQLARAMVMRWGMSDKVGNIDYAEAHEGYSGQTAGFSVSAKTKETVEAEVKRLIDAGYDRAHKILTEKSEEFERMAQGLLEYETLTGAEIKRVIAGEPPRADDDDDPEITPTDGSGSVTAIPSAGKSRPKGGDLEPEPQT